MNSSSNSKSFEYKSGVFTNFLNKIYKLIEYQSNVFTKLLNICPKYLQIFLNGIKLVIVADVTENLLNSKQEVFTNLLNSNSLGVSIVTPNLLNITTNLLKTRSIYQDFKYYSESFEYNSKSSEYESHVISVLTANIWNGNSEVFKYVLNKSSGSNSFALIK
ncbi:hypothetical protein L873DRAFT_1795855 [Choiromyces venosus 120613-1]|uniref:Uncharacterized protein n=1 Tax=Choiromyces venosus 120613-1 TaxID=1336337 RepID=A0A3N4J084_9PEZI|nr:hypothetical protein L873DRAFT_1795855 [Choiromyces venosus 120613-1]